MSEPQQDPTPIADAFALGPEPTWLRCACGELSAQRVCWTCHQRAEADRRAAEMLRASDATIPPAFRWATLEAPDLAARVDARRRSFDDLVKGILASQRVILAGGSGAGKTSLAVACLRTRTRHGARFVSACDLATARIQHAAGDGEALVVEQAITAPLLLLDDLGEEQHTATSAVRDVIRARHLAGRATWVTTGFRKGEIVARYGDGIRRRLWDGAFAMWLGPEPKT